MRAVALTELVPRPPAGRVFAEQVRTGIGEATATHRVRLDAIARWLQDAAYWDLVDAGWEAPQPWFVRRLRMRVERFPLFAEALDLVTWCSGTGPAVAERRTSIRGERGAAVEAVAQWVHLDPETARPRPLGDEFMAVYGPSAAGRRAPTRLRHPAPPDEPIAQRRFDFRVTDVDPARHVNNAVYWAAIEEELADREAHAGVDAEVEHRAAALPGPVRLLSDGAWGRPETATWPSEAGPPVGHRWMVDDEGLLVASFVVRDAG
ncbi:MAG TPA: acyl-ACP thioesterase domain-containing protein [Solirubrobacteraceae bacterium]|nr:acyl-ACP thioesterase domain-containing protein [Solirubrobacteraceae bacterium]